MYYVIQLLHDGREKHFVSYQVPKYILSSKNHNIIFEFGEKPNVKRKWAPKEDIILLTQNKEFFQAYLTKLTQLEKEHLAQINAAQQEIERLEIHYKEQIHSELTNFKQLAKKNKKIPTLL